ncbi:MAG: sulfite exporter TauE/SafE family protein [Desulfobulbaceae bacterium]|nr:sulfite exporter TauE/SafE family protein [Desulfobulbaceae bacterium]
MLLLIGIYLAAGAVAGILAGLMGIGGGLVIVPMLVYCFSLQDIDQAHIMHLALGTSLASIIFTSVSSFMAHHRRRAVHWDIVRQIVPGIIAGTLAGAYLASLLSTDVLQGIFGLFLYYVALQMFLNRKPQASRTLPGTTGMLGAGGLIGVVSSLLGIGGGTLSVPFMMWCNITVHHAIGTASAIGFPIAVAGTAGYILTGLQTAGLPAFTVGYVSLPALLGIVSASILTAPLGARLAHWLPVAQLKRIFAVLLLLVGSTMLAGLF